MTITEAAHDLHDRLAREPWFSAVGVGLSEGRDAIFLYVKTRKAARSASLPPTWHGYPVVVKVMDSPRLL